MILQNTDPVPRGESLQLIVAVHAWTSSSVRLSGVRDVVAKEMPDADLLFPDYPASVFSRADPVDITQSLVTAISNAVSSRECKGAPYQQIILIGHSLGALLIRKAYVFARGQTQDMYGPLVAQPRDWAGLVTRIILMAGTNRGWSLSKKARNLSWPMWLGFTASGVLWRWFRLGKLINNARRGAPFVVNLRIQWLNLVRDTTSPQPVTIQLLGDIDDIVSEEDNVDVQSGANFIYRRVTGTGHANVIHFDGPAGRSRQEQFLYALKTCPEDLESDAIAPLEQDPDTKLVVFVMHGIRDYGFWTRKVAQRIEELSIAKGKKTRAITSGYGYFPMLSFLLQPERQKNVRWFMDQYTEALARYPQAKIGYIGHSNGSYLLASALERYAACEFDRVVFAGSVVYRNFPWDKMVNEKRVTAIQNYVATRDWVVGIFPALFEYLPRTDLGSAGHSGFTDNEGHRHEIAFIEGSHGAAVAPENFDTLARFVLGEDAVTPPPTITHDYQSPWVVTASKLCWFIWIFLFMLAIVPVATLWTLSQTGNWSFGWVSWWMPALVWLMSLFALLRTI